MTRFKIIIDREDHLGITIKEATFNKQSHQKGIRDHLISEKLGIHRIKR